MNTIKKLFFIPFIFIISFMLVSCMEVGTNTPVKQQNNTGLITNSKLNVHFIDVGQGDSILIESDGKFMLIDAGENDKGNLVCNYLTANGVTELEYLIGTHPHSDHIGGLDTVINNFDVKNVIMPEKTSNTKTFEDVIKAVENKGLTITPPVLGSKYQIGNSEFTIIAPVKDDYGDEANNYSVGIKLVCGETSFVLCGDAEKEAEKDIVDSGADINADVLKLGHHGSSTSSSSVFLDAVNPSAVVIMCGKNNKYGHPHQETMTEIENRGLQTFRTDEYGTIIAQSDGSDITWVVSGDTVKEETESTQSSTVSSVSSDTVKEETESTQSSTVSSNTSNYVLNTNTKKIHKPNCNSVSEIQPSNRENSDETKSELVSKGYQPCKRCKP